MIKLLKYDYYNIPLLQRILKFNDYSEMINTLNYKRIVTRKELCNMPSFTWNQGQNVFEFKSTFKNEFDGNNEIRTLTALGYAASQLFSDLLDVNITNFIKKVKSIDERAKNHKYLGNGHPTPITKGNIKKLNDIMQQVWYIAKIEKQKKVYCHIVEKSPLSAKARIGSFVSENYVYKKDADVFAMIQQEGQKINRDIEFYDGYITAIKSRMNLINKSSELVNDTNTLIGISVVNSEFKESALRFESTIFFPEMDNIKLYGTTANLSTSIRHYGDSKAFDEELKRKIEVILGKSEKLISLFDMSSSRESFDFDVEEKDDEGDLMIVKALGISKRLGKRIVEIHATKGFPDNEHGILYSLMDYATHQAKTESERMRVNDKALELLVNPEHFKEVMGREISRADLLIL